MTSSFRLGRIAGVEVGVNWSVLIVFVLLAWALAAGRLPGDYPGRPAWAYAAAGLSAAVVFLLGLLAHELSHAVVARRNGVPVDGITLWVLGGVARLRGEAPNPGADARIAAAGPAASVLIGGGFAALATVTALAGWHGLVFGTFSWLAAINLLLAGFNLLPAAPLDGGRLLRAGLWRWRGERTWAAVAAARTGRMFGALLIAAGLGRLLYGAAIGGLWLMMVGWFIVSAAIAEERQAGVDKAVAGLRVTDVMTPQPATLPADLTVADFMDGPVRAARHSAFPLVDGAHPAGLVTLKRIGKVPQDQWASTRLRDVGRALGEVPVVSPDEPVADLLQRLNESTAGRALVARDDDLVGIVSPSDISRAVQRASLLRQPR